MQIAILILVFITLLGALAWHGGRDLWTQRHSPQSKLYWTIAAVLGLIAIDLATSSEISIVTFIIAGAAWGSILHNYRINRQQNPA